MYRDLLNMIIENSFLVPEKILQKTMKDDYLMFVVEAGNNGKKEENQEVSKDLKNKYKSLKD